MQYRLKIKHCLFIKKTSFYCYNLLIKIIDVNNYTLIHCYYYTKAIFDIHSAIIFIYFITIISCQYSTIDNIMRHSLVCSSPKGYYVSSCLTSVQEHWGQLHA